MIPNGWMKAMAVMVGCALLAGAAFGQTPTPDPCAPDATEAYFVGAGNASLALRDYSTAETRYTCALLRDGASVDALARRGYVRSVLGNDAGALADFAAALTLDERRVEVYINRGVLYLRQGNFALAMGDLDLALTLEPGNARALHNRAIAHAAEGAFTRALADIDAALAITPDDPALHAAKGAIYLGLANTSYARFRSLAGDSAPFFGGAPTNVYLALERNLTTGSFGEWLGFLRPAREES
jgi:tetratricopeptide (TPR) repeat protein